MSSRPSVWLGRFALLVAASGLAAPAQAQFPGDVPDTFRLRLGGAYAWFNTEVTFQENVTPGGPVGAGVDMENLLQRSQPGFAARGQWNFLGRLFLDFGYTGFRRSRTQGIDTEFTFGDATYLVDASVSASVKSDLPYLDFRYGIIKNDSVQFGISLGAAYTILEAEASASGHVVGPGGPIDGAVTRLAKISVPVPLLGLMFETKLADRLAAGVLVNGIFAPVHPYTGSVIDAEAHIDWYLARNFGISAAFDYTRFNIKREDELALVEFRYSYYGPRVYFIVTF